MLSDLARLLMSLLSTDIVALDRDLFIRKVHMLAIGIANKKAFNW
ncbi:hypothetical protein EV05_1255 [Prochlorococcus sp. MIT 0601]|nr:hypothetical protein EV05_1255 [Prochlorococcus sp. MIT 0601]